MTSKVMNSKTNCRLACLNSRLLLSASWIHLF